LSPVDIDAVETAWGKLTGQTQFGRAGTIPVYDESQQGWRIFRNTYTIYEAAENGADPEKVEQLRRNVVALLERFPQTIPELEKLGMRTKQLVNHPIKTTEDVDTWAKSFFNYGPIVAKVPLHVSDTMGVAYDDLVIEVKSGRNPIYVVPAGPRGSGNNAVLNFARPGLKEKFGPRHAYAKLAFAVQIAALRKTQREEAAAARKSDRPRGRPRRDGLVPGSPEAKTADELKRKEQRLAKRRPVTPEPVAAAAPEPRIRKIRRRPR
jgi:Family of unknown function (DUF6424)